MGFQIQNNPNDAVAVYIENINGQNMCYLLY